MRLEYTVWCLWIGIAVLGIARHTTTSRWIIIASGLLLGFAVWVAPARASLLAVASMLVWMGFAIQRWLREAEAQNEAPRDAGAGHVYRPDIDGLRAVAIVPVVLYHAFPALIPGGFVGVDIFFVISGFLITQILLEQHARGTFTYRDFYTRRVRRIFPALAVVLFSTLVCGWFVLFPDEFASLAQHIIAGTLFVSNLLSYSTVDYFAPASYQVPLIHLWSLGVEEQFYILWPVVIGLCARRPRWLIPSFALIIISSFATTQYLQLSNPDAAFYWPISRVWELALGGVAAVLTLRGTLRPTTQVQQRINAELAAYGAGLLVTAFVLINDATIFPGVWALLPTIGAGLVIVAGQQTWVARRVLAQPAFVWIGLISYPLYLWHWPILSFATVYLEQAFTPQWRAVAVLVSVGCAYATYRCLELRVRTRVQGVFTIATPRILLATAAAALVAGCVMFLNPPTYLSPRLAAQTLKSAQYAQSRRTQLVRCTKLGIAPEFRGRCLYKAGSDSTSSDYIVIGDSLSMALAETLLDGAHPHAVLSLGRHGCLPFPRLERYDDGRSLGCAGAGAIEGIFEALQHLPVTRDRVIFVVGRYANIEGRKLNPNETKVIVLKRTDQPAPQTDEERLAAYRDAMDDMFTALTALPRTTVVFVDQFPEFSYAPLSCLRWQMRGNGNECTMPRATIDSFFARYRGIVAELLRTHPSVQRIDTLETFCDAESCYAMRDGQLLYRDDTHPNLLGVQQLQDEIPRRFP